MTDAPAAPAKAANPETAMLFRRNRSRALDRHHSTYYRYEHNVEKGPMRSEIYTWRLEDGVEVVLTREIFHFPFETWENWLLITLTVDGRPIEVTQIDEHYPFDGSGAPQRIEYTTVDGKLVMHHVNIEGTRDFDEWALWLDRPLALQATEGVKWLCANCGVLEVPRLHAWCPCCQTTNDPW